MDATPITRLRRCGVAPEEVEEQFARSSGPGGQNVNKVETRVRLLHRPSGISVTVSDHRHRERNRQTAWLRLAEKFEALREEKRQQQAARRSRARARNARPSAGTKRRMVETKRRRGEIKKLRGRVE